MMYSTLFSTVVVASFWGYVQAESHTIRFVNKCGKGTPQLVQAGVIKSTGSDFTSDGPFETGLAYLQTGECLLNGENCALVEMNMNNPACPGCGSSVDISIIPTHALNVETAFSFFGGDGNQCDGLGASCADPNCDTAFHVPDDNQVQRACQADNVNLLITFCGGGGTAFTSAVPNSLSNLSPTNASSAPSSPISAPSTNPVPPAQNTSGGNNTQTPPSSGQNNPSNHSANPSQNSASPPASAARNTGRCVPRPKKRDNVKLRADAEHQTGNLRVRHAHARASSRRRSRF